MRADVILGFLDELGKIAQEIPMQPPPPAVGGASGVMGMSGGAGSPPAQDPSSLVGSKNFGANKPKPVEPADVVSGMNSGQGAPGLPKMGGVVDLGARAVTGVATQAARSPGMAFWRFQQQKKGLSKHKQTMLALKHGYPAGWVGLNMRPG